MYDVYITDMLFLLMAQNFKKYYVFKNRNDDLKVLKLLKFEEANIVLGKE